MKNKDGPRELVFLKTIYFDQLHFPRISKVSYLCNDIAYTVRRISHELEE